MLGPFQDGAVTGNAGNYLSGSSFYSASGFWFPPLMPVPFRFNGGTISAKPISGWCCYRKCGEFFDRQQLLFCCRFLVPMADARLFLFDGGQVST
jgi:hypothetical protein